MPKGPSATDHGVKIELTRQLDDAAPWRYEGVVRRGDSSWSVRATIAADGAVDVESAKSESAEAGPDEPQMRDRVRLILRACYKQFTAEGLRAPPRKIVRWREERV